jgi:hypothetical protein
MDRKVLRLVTDVTISPEARLLYLAHLAFRASGIELDPAAVAGACGLRMDPAEAGKALRAVRRRHRFGETVRPRAAEGGNRDGSRTASPEPVRHHREEISDPERLDIDSLPPEAREEARRFFRAAIRARVRRRMARTKAEAVLAEMKDLARRFGGEALAEGIRIQLGKEDFDWGQRNLTGYLKRVVESRSRTRPHERRDAGDRPRAVPHEEVARVAAAERALREGVSREEAGRLLPLEAGT